MLCTRMLGLSFVLSSRLHAHAAYMHVDPCCVQAASNAGTSMLHACNARAAMLLAKNARALQACNMDVPACNACAPPRVACP